MMQFWRTRRGRLTKFVGVHAVEPAPLVWQI